MSWTVDQAMRDTQEWFRTRLDKEVFEELDFSYITQGLLDCYTKYAKPKNEELVEDLRKWGLLPSLEAKPSWTYYGHHVTINGAERKAYFTNSNSSDGPDSPGDMCWGYNRWNARIYEASPPERCPSNSQGGDTGGRGMR